MKYVLAILPLLKLTCILAQGTSLEYYPGIHDFVYVEKEPRVLNYEEVRRLIGYPIKALKEKIEGKVFCRLLVNDRGEYVDHVVTRPSHPLLMDAIHAQIAKLKFIPASRNNRPVPYWVNVPFVFTAGNLQHKLWKRSSSNALHVSQMLGGEKRSREYVAVGEEQLKDGAFLQAKASFEKAIATNPTSFRAKESSKELLFTSYYGKAKAEMASQLWGDAFESLTHAIGTGRTISENDLSRIELEGMQQAYIDRAKAFLKRGEPIKALDDCNWVLKHYPEREFQSRAFAYRGLVHLKLGQIPAAFKDIQEAMDLDPTFAEPYYFKALVLIHLDGYEAANPLLEQALLLGLSGDDQEIAESLLFKYSQNHE